MNTIKTTFTAVLLAAIIALSAATASAQTIVQSDDGSIYDPANNASGAIVVWPLYDETSAEHCSVWFPSRTEAQPYADETGGVVVGATYSLMEKLPECGA